MCFYPSGYMYTAISGPILREIRGILAPFRSAHYTLAVVEAAKGGNQPHKNPVEGWRPSKIPQVREEQSTHRQLV